MSNLRCVFLRKALFGVLALSTIGLFIMTFWTGSIVLTMNSQLDQSATDTFQYAVGDTPIEANITLRTFREMYEDVSTPVHFNITLVIQGPSPMNMTIRSIEFLLSPLDLENRTEANLPRIVGSFGVMLQITNATRVTIEGSAQITPVIITGDVFLGCGVDYLISNGTSSSSCEWGENCWFAIDGSLFMLPVVVYPSVLRLEGWSYGLTGGLLIWCLIALNVFRKRWA